MDPDVGDRRSIQQGRVDPVLIAGLTIWRSHGVDGVDRLWVPIQMMVYGLLKKLGKVSFNWVIRIVRTVPW